MLISERFVLRIGYFLLPLSCYSLAQPTNKARAEPQARLGYALQGGGRSKRFNRRMKQEQVPKLAWAMPCKEEEEPRRLNGLQRV